VNLKEIRCVKHLVEAATEIGQLHLLDYERFERAMWPDDHDMNRFTMTPEQFRRCVRAAWMELKRR
jgi:hypothetical protein